MPVYDSFNGGFLGFAEFFVNPNGFAVLDKDGNPEMKKDENGKPIISKDPANGGGVPTGVSIPNIRVRIHQT